MLTWQAGAPPGPQHQRRGHRRAHGRLGRLALACLPRASAWPPAGGSCCCRSGGADDVAPSAELSSRREALPGRGGERLCSARPRPHQRAAVPSRRPSRRAARRDQVRGAGTLKGGLCVAGSAARHGYGPLLCLPVVHFLATIYNR